MSTCSIQITTTADGVESRLSKKGRIVEVSATGVRLEYEEEQAHVFMQVGQAKVQIRRIGDYTLDLILSEGETQEGALGIGGSSGVVYTKTHRLEYLLKEKSLLLLAHYDLIVGGEAQEMKIRLRAEWA